MLHPPVLLTIAGRYGYGPTEAFNRSLRSVHGEATYELWLPTERS